MLIQQELLVSELMGIMLSILNSKDDRPKKVSKWTDLLGLSEPLGLAGPASEPLGLALRVSWPCE